MPWRMEADAVLGLTRAAQEALARGDLDAVAALLEERGSRVARLGSAVGEDRRDPELPGLLERIRAEEGALAAALRAGLAATGQALGRLSAVPAAAPADTASACDRRA